MSGFEGVGSGVFKAMVRSDSFRSARTMDFWKSGPCWAWWSGGSSTSARRSSSATSGMVAATAWERQMKRSWRPIVCAPDGEDGSRGECWVEAAAIGPVKVLEGGLVGRAEQGVVVAGSGEDDKGKKHNGDGLEELGFVD